VIWLFTCYDIYESLFLSAAKRSPVAQRVRKVLDFILGVLTLFLLTSPDTFEPQKVTTTVQGGGRPPSFKRRAAVLSSILLLIGWYLGWPVIGYIFDPGSSDNVLSSLFAAGWVLWGLCSLVVSAFVLIYLPMRWPVPFGISFLLYLLIVVYLALAHHAVQQ